MTEKNKDMDRRDEKEESKEIFTKPRLLFIGFILGFITSMFLAPIIKRFAYLIAIVAILLLIIYLFIIKEKSKTRDDV